MGNWVGRKSVAQNVRSRSDIIPTQSVDAPVVSGRDSLIAILEDTIHKHFEFAFIIQRSRNRR
ncbi:MAG: hypothetical protein VYC82_01570 [Verrucomicrobiota bacterium]|nr:hypothetical protein [Verrucomicrobiota bacterium]